MAASLLPGTFLATSGGLLYAFEQATLPGRLVLLALFLGSVFSWTVMVTKFRVVKRAQLQRGPYPIIMRESDGAMCLDLRTVFPRWDQQLVAAVTEITSR